MEERMGERNRLGLEPMQVTAKLISFPGLFSPRGTIFRVRIYHIFYDAKLGRKWEKGRRKDGRWLLRFIFTGELCNF
jgi:hypothetical protein